MATDLSEKTTINRRSLIAAAAAAAAASAGSAEAASHTINWDAEFDIVIAGFGLAGCSAAIESLDTNPNAKVLILEKALEEHAGGNSRVSGQSLWRPKPNKKALMDYQRNISKPNPVPEELLEFWADQLLELEPWIRDRAKEANQEYVTSPGTKEMPEFGAEEAVGGSTILPRAGGLWEAFKKNIDKRNVTVWFESPAVELVQDCESGEVFGLIVEQAGKRISVRARGGVVMAMGGFENNLDMQRNYFGLAEVYPLGSPGNTGDGIRILQKAGADMWHMRNRGQSGGIWPGFKVPDFEGGFLRNTLFTAFSWIDIAADDQRFYNETANLHRTHYKYNHHGTWVDVPLHHAQPVYMIFDETTRQNMCLVTKFMTWNTVVNRYRWTDDNQAEVEQGWIAKSDSIEGLAELINRDPQRVKATVERYNAACTVTIDAEYGRNPDTLAPIAQPPFYAIEVVPTIVCTSGGAKRTIESEVIGHDGNTILRLYEAGELGSMISDLYQNSCYLTEAMISGRTAGKNVAGLAPWTD